MYGSAEPGDQDVEWLYKHLVDRSEYYRGDYYGSEYYGGDYFPSVMSYERYFQEIHIGIPMIDFWFESLAVLKNVNELAKMTYKTEDAIIDGSLRLKDCPLLQDISGFSGFKRLRQLIQGAPNMNDPRQMYNDHRLAYVYTPSPIFIENVGLTNLTGLEGLTGPAGGVNLTNLPLLENVDALAGLTEITFRLESIDPYAVTNFIQMLPGGIDEIKWTADGIPAASLWLQNVPLLRSLPGFHGLRGSLDGLFLMTLVSVEDISSLGVGITEIGELLFHNLPKLKYFCPPILESPAGIFNFF